MYTSKSRIDLYQLHHPDPGVPLADSVGALEQLRREGKVAAIGLSNVTIAQRGIAYLAYSPLGGSSDAPSAAAAAVARRRGVSVQRVLLGWLRAQSPNIVPLVGASRPATIRDSAALLDLPGADLEDLRHA